jgi:hypothetical protein
VTNFPAPKSTVVDPDLLDVIGYSLFGHKCSCSNIGVEHKQAMQQEKDSYTVKLDAVFLRRRSSGLRCRGLGHIGVVVGFVRDTIVGWVASQPRRT